MMILITKKRNGVNYDQHTRDTSGKRDRCNFSALLIVISNSYCTNESIWWKTYNFLLIVTFIATINETLSFIIDARPGFIFSSIYFKYNLHRCFSDCWILLVSICRISYLSKHESHQKEVKNLIHSINNYHNFINYQFIWKWHHLQYFWEK